MSHRNYDSSIKEEEKSHETKLDRMIRDDPLSYRIEPDQEIKIKTKKDTNTRRHLSVINEYIKFIFDENSPELKEHLLIYIQYIY